MIDGIAKRLLTALLVTTSVTRNPFSAPSGAELADATDFGNGTIVDGGDDASSVEPPAITIPTSPSLPAGERSLAGVVRARSLSTTPREIGGQPTIRGNRPMTRRTRPMAGSSWSGEGGI